MRFVLTLAGAGIVVTAIVEGLTLLLGCGCPTCTDRRARLRGWLRRAV